jgi:hypothetical protein
VLTGAAEAETDAAASAKAITDFFMIFPQVNCSGKYLAEIVPII